jgi:hypothetical protein
MLMPVGFKDARHELFLGVGVGRIAHQAFLFRELLTKKEGVFPLKFWAGRFRGLCCFPDFYRACGWLTHGLSPYKKF